LKTIAVLTSGGDAPGDERGGARRDRGGWRAAGGFGVRNGYAGLLENALEPLQARNVGGIIQSGGTVLGSARCPEFTEARDAPRRSPIFAARESMPWR